jgi:hypothetical protein
LKKNGKLGTLKTLVLVDFHGWNKNANKYVPTIVRAIP